MTGNAAALIAISQLGRLTMRKLLTFLIALAAVVGVTASSFGGGMMLLGVGKPAAGGSPVTLTFQANGLGSTATNTYTFGTLTLGAAPSANRRIVLLFASGDLSTGTGDTISSVVFTPNAGGTVNADTIISIGADTNDGMAVISAVLPVGTTSTLVVTISGTAFNSPRFVFYTVDNSTLSSPTSPVTGYATMNTAATTLTATVNTLAGGAVIAQFSGNASGGAFTSGVTASDGAFGNYLWGHVNNVAAATPFSVTNTWAGANNPAGLGLVAYR